MDGLGYLIQHTIPQQARQKQSDSIISIIGLLHKHWIIIASAVIIQFIHYYFIISLLFIIIHLFIFILVHKLLT